MGATGEIIAMSDAHRESGGAITDLLTEGKRLCDINNTQHPQVIFTDNAQAQESIIKCVFPGCRVAQDLKHLINRLIETCPKNHALYGQFCKNLHSAFTSDAKVPALSRSGRWHMVVPPLKPPSIIIANVEALITYYKSLQTPASAGPPLLSSTFDAAWIIQKLQITKYIFEVVVNGKLNRLANQ
jgi:hypothetical protein